MTRLRPNGGSDGRADQGGAVHPLEGALLGARPVHRRIRSTAIRAARAEPYNVMVHPECAWEVCQAADLVGSTEYIIKQVEQAEPGTHWAIGTENHLVQRLAMQNPDKHVRSLAGFNACARRCTASTCVTCTGAWSGCVRGEVVNQIRVDAETAHWSKVALDRMLALKPDGLMSAK
jgi:quinolinate synthase